MNEEELRDTPEDADAVSPEEQDTELEQAIDAANESVAVQTSKLSELQEGDGAGESTDIGHLLEVPVEVTVELGHGQMSLGNLARLERGSLVRLDREAHEPAAILVNGKTVAYGEIVTIGESYGVRISRVEG